LGSSSASMDWPARERSLETEDGAVGVAVSSEVAGVWIDVSLLLGVEVGRGVVGAMGVAGAVGSEAASGVGAGAVVRSAVPRDAL